MVKRKGYILEKIADLDNLRAADHDAQSGKVKTNRYIREHNRHAEDDLLKLRQMILTLKFPVNDYEIMSIQSDAGKVREIVKQKYFPWRILHHAIMRVIGPDLYNSLIYDTSACIKGKGLLFGARRVKMFLRRYPEYKYCVKTDFKKFYQSIPHETLLNALRRKFKDERFIKLIELTILNYDSGIESILEDERQKRNHNWGIHQSTVRQFGSQQP
jgi:hypothetical protein